VFTTMAPDAHVPTNIAVIEQFLPVKFRVEPLGHGRFEVAVEHR
jgi:RNA 3'-terminal phosphate cyclase